MHRGRQEIDRVSVGISDRSCPRPVIWVDSHPLALKALVRISGDDGARWRGKCGGVQNLLGQHYSTSRVQAMWGEAFAAAVPEPPSLMLCALGLLVLGAAARPRSGVALPVRRLGDQTVLRWYAQQNRLPGGRGRGGTGAEVDACGSPCPR